MSDEQLSSSAPTNLRAMISAASPVHVGLSLMLLGLFLPWATSGQGQMAVNINGFSMFQAAGTLYSNLSGFIAYLILLGAGLLLILNFLDHRFVLKANHVLVAAFSLIAGLSSYIVLSSRVLAAPLAPGAMVVPLATVIMLIFSLTKVRWRDFEVSLLLKLAPLPVISAALLFVFGSGFVGFIFELGHMKLIYREIMEPFKVRALGPLIVCLWALLLVLAAAYLRNTFTGRTILVNCIIVLLLLIAGSTYSVQISAPASIRTVAIATESYSAWQIYLSVWRGIVLDAHAALLAYLIVVIGLSAKSIASAASPLSSEVET